MPSKNRKQKQRVLVTYAVDVRETSTELAVIYPDGQVQYHPKDWEFCGGEDTLFQYFERAAQDKRYNYFVDEEGHMNGKDLNRNVWFTNRGGWHPVGPVVRKKK